MIPSARECPQTLRLLLLLAASLIAAVPAATQQPESNTQFGEQIDVRVVTLPVVVRDGRGRAVTDLQAGEITVREGKKTYRVESLTRYIAPPGKRADLPRVRLITNLDSERRQVSTTATAEPRYMVIVVDVENDPLVERKRATDALKRFLETELDPTFQVALLLFDGQVRQLVPFTQERRAVVAALDNVHTERKARARLAPGTAMPQMIAKLPLCRDMEFHEQVVQCLHDTATEYANEVTMQASAFVDALDGIVGYVEGLEGHKSVLVVGGSVSLNPAGEAAEALRAVFGHMNEITEWEQSARADEVVRPRLDAVFVRAFRNRVSISFVDRTPAPSDVSARFGEQFQPGFRPMSAAFQAAQQDLNEIAATTGGSFVASTRVDEGLRQAMALMEGAYDLTIYLPDNEPLTPRRLRRISIESERRGVRISHRRGFEGGRPDQEPSEQLRGRVDTGAYVQQELDGATIDVVPLRFVLDPADLGYEEKGDVASAHFTVHLRLRTAEGELLTDLYRVLTHTYPLERWRGQDVEPPALLAFADVPPGDYIAEAVVTVPRLRQRGTLSREFTAAAMVAETAVEAPVAEPEIAAAELPPAEEVPVQRRAGSSPTSTPRTDAVAPPSIAFARHFLGVVNGDVDVSVLVGADVASVELLLDGESVGAVDEDPWTVPLSLGDALSPRELVAVARDGNGREVGRARQWLNLPRPWTELEVVLSDGGGGALTGRVALESVGGQRARQVTVTLDGSPVWVSNSPTFLLPALDMTDIHILRVEAEFENAGVVSKDIVLGGRYVHQASAELTSVALQVPRSGEPRLEHIRIHAGGRPVSAVALEKGAADVIVVIDPHAIRMLPGITVAGSGDFARVSLARGLDGTLTPPQKDIHLRLLWPIALRAGAAGQLGYRLFPSTDPDAPSAGGFLAHVAGAAFPSDDGPVRLADAVAVAGPMAVERGRRRIVLLVHGGSRSEGKYSAAAVRAYLEQLRVPLVVWSTGKPTRGVLDDWGSMEIVSTRVGLRNAWVNLHRMLDRQRVAWLEGMYLPQALETVGREIELAGVRK